MSEKVDCNFGFSYLGVAWARRRLGRGSPHSGSPMISSSLGCFSTGPGSSG